MDKDLMLKKDTKEFTKIALELYSINPKLFEIYKNRMMGAVEVQKLMENKDIGWFED